MNVWKLKMSKKSLNERHYNPLPYESVEDRNCRHDHIEYSFLESIDGSHVWKCCKCGTKFNVQEFEAIKE